MTAPSAPLDIQAISDLHLAELLAAQMALLYQTKDNVAALQAELQRRKELQKLPSQ